MGWLRGSGLVEGGLMDESGLIEGGLEKSHL